jgi:hypothetical protein
MATITPSTTYTDGAALDIAGHNANIFSAVSGKGVLSEPNGGLEQVNLDPGSVLPFREPFRIHDEHVMSEEAVIARQESLTVPMDIFSNAFGDPGVEEDDVREKSFVAIAGLSQRVYVPYDVSAMIWQWSFFAAVYRAEIGDEAPAIVIRAYLDGQRLDSYIRPLVASDILSASGVNNAASSNEDIVAMWYDFSKLTKNVSKGYHELSVKVYMARAERRVSFYAEGIIPDAEDPEDTYYYSVHSRVTFGVRNIRCISFK